MATRRTTRRSQHLPPPVEEPKIQDKQLKKNEAKAHPARKPREVRPPPQKKARKAFGDITNSPGKKNKKPSDLIKDCPKDPGKPGKRTVKAKKKSQGKTEASQASADSAIADVCSSQETTSSQDSTLPCTSESLLPSSQESLPPTVQEIQSSQSSSTSSESDVPSQDNVSISSKSDISMKSVDEDNEAITIWEDVDTDSDVTFCAMFADFIFSTYYKKREARFAIADYMSTQEEITEQMRAVLVDWMVEVQENFELNHETLYLAIKLVDMVASREPVSKEELQCLGATAIFIACKFDERIPPIIDDFRYICDDTYSKRIILLMEQRILKTIDFDLGAPLSYSYLRRYAKCGRQNLRTLTLARYILETSLLDYQYSLKSDSLMAAASLLLAMRMTNSGHWGVTLVHYTKFVEEDLKELVKMLNESIARPRFTNTTSISTKYSHPVFLEVARISPLDI